MSKRGKHLRLAGLVIGLTGTIIWTIFVCATTHWNATVSLVLYFTIPFLFGTLIAWRWPLAGGTILICVALYWLTRFAGIGDLPTAVPRPLVYIILTMPIPLLPLAPAILFLLSWKVERRKSSK